jgi:hypothetical protein
MEGIDLEAPRGTDRKTWARKMVLWVGAAQLIAFELPTLSKADPMMFPDLEIGAWVWRWPEISLDVLQRLAPAFGAVLIGLGLIPWAGAWPLLGAAVSQLLVTHGSVLPTPSSITFASALVMVWDRLPPLGDAGVLIAHRIRHLHGSGRASRWIGASSAVFLLSLLAVLPTVGITAHEYVELVAKSPSLVVYHVLYLIWAALAMCVALPRRTPDGTIVVVRWIAIARLCAPMLEWVTLEAPSSAELPPIGRAFGSLKDLHTSFEMLLVFVGLSAFIEDRMARRSRGRVAEVFA